VGSNLGPRSAPLQPAAESSIGTVSDSEAQARRLAYGAVDVLPAGQLERRLSEGRPLRVKLGIDPTAPDIHLGHVVVLEKLRQFQEEGHTVVLIIGDYTARVGDPSGLSSERPVLSPEEIESNAATFTAQAFKVLDRDRTEIRFNSEWLEMPSVDLFDLARRFTVARLLERDDFTRRMAAGEPISALELLYPVLQGYDSVAVEADVELGGTDQKFNLLFGRDVQAAYDRPAQSIVTMPILPGTDGKRRMSKSLGNYIGITDEPAEMFGKLMSVPDDAMASYWTLLLGEDLDPARHPGEAKRDLARRLVDRFAGKGQGAVAEARFDEVHVRREVPDDIPAVALEGSSETIHLPGFLAQHFDISSSEARRLIGQGAVRLDGRAIAEDGLEVERAVLAGSVIQVGKRRFLRVLAAD
jgi:tyrosyl-tRNA synthetase